MAGLPGVIVASIGFRDAVLSQSRGLGFEPAVVYLPHPIQDRSDEEMRALAEGCVGDIIKALTASPPETKP
jgi:hypothetical protein